MSIILAKADWWAFWPWNFIGSVHFWPKLMWTGLINEDYICENSFKCGLCLPFWPKLIGRYFWPQNFIDLVHFWPKLMWTRLIKEAHLIKCGLCLSFWPKLIDRHFTTIFYWSCSFLAKADMRRINKRSLNMRIIKVWLAFIISGQSWLMNACSQNFVVLTHFWPKLMGVWSMKEWCSNAYQKQLNSFAASNASYIAGIINDIK